MAAYCGLLGGMLALFGVIGGVIAIEEKNSLAPPLIAFVGGLILVSLADVAYKLGLLLKKKE